MKPKMLTHPSYARCIDSPAEVERLLAQGWVITAPKPRTKSAGRMRALRAQRRAAGWANLTLWVDPEQLIAITSAQHPGETVVQMLMRLIEKQSSL